MRKTRDDRVKITTHHFRISIEEEEDEEGEGAKKVISDLVRTASVSSDTRFSIKIEADPEILGSPLIPPREDAARNGASGSTDSRDRRREPSLEEPLEIVTIETEFPPAKSVGHEGFVGQRQQWKNQLLRTKGHESQISRFEDRTGFSESRKSEGSRDFTESEANNDTRETSEARKISGSSEGHGESEALQNDGIKRDTVNLDIPEMPLAHEDQLIAGRENLLAMTNAGQNLATFHEENVGILYSTLKCSVGAAARESANPMKKSSSDASRSSSDASASLRDRSEPNLAESRGRVPNSSDFDGSTATQEPQKTPCRDLRRQLSEGRATISASRIQSTLIVSRSMRSNTIPSHLSASPLLVRRYQKATADSLERNSLDEVVSSSGDTPMADSTGIEDRAPKSSKPDDQARMKRRLTLPIINVDQNSREQSTSPTHEEALSGTSVNPIRRSSIANAAICSSLAPSLLSAFPGIPNCLLPSSEDNASSTLQTSPSVSEQITKTGRKLKFPFLRLHIPEPRPSTWEDEEGGFEEHYTHHHHHHHHHNHHHHMFPYFHVPTITFTAPAADGETGRKFNFGIRRHSQTVSHVACLFIVKMDAVDAVVSLSGADCCEDLATRQVPVSVLTLTLRIVFVGMLLTLCIPIRFELTDIALKIIVFLRNAD